ncbi:uncharacterized protein LOC106378843 [Brassica napus]|uniref:uncharacterized protein LOC106321082 n=1 Tax=Brassica oleracea var. oleracea TaxID=109376 RepID=UPI0006A6F0B2|nr:PREDICTED: uncharacterized protein LOC106321082 [Brassica oleracea var. oleracea]XP_013674359.1 uncharacterized protein LOC106378843 [Brassica napus]
MARSFHRVEVRNGENTSFWHKTWSSSGCLSDILGERVTDLGLPAHTTVQEAMMFHRRRHRTTILNRIEDEIDERKANADNAEDVSLWKGIGGKYKKRSSTKTTWMLLRDQQPLCQWSKGVWFRHSTPKFAFMTWYALKNRLATGDRLLQWGGNVDGSCISFKKLSIAYGEKEIKGDMGKLIYTSAAS